MKDSVLLLAVLFSLSVLVSQTVGGRVKAPLLRQSNTNGLVFSKSFNSIYDTSMYGRLQLNNGLARTPQMGWNSWNFFACNINETVIKETGESPTSIRSRKSLAVASHEKSPPRERNPSFRK
ncbi:hypothetical protein F2Q70_00040979 [Brassica cretica]|uniref:Uncharacterized protein n=1 Tax=Brassica cretica TaxID=69181 RepID=A0A8S9K766_BRACR|nr:hypothetical protein F2Q70_00040979 [Brassica cretica]